MKTKILLNILFAFFITSCIAQNNRIENALTACSYEAFSDNGIAFKNKISSYQNLLIKEKIITDPSGKSYLQLLQKFADGKGLNKVPSKLFIAELQTIKSPNSDKTRECQKIIKNASEEYNNTTFKAFEKVISNQYSPNSLVVALLKLVTEEDLELDFYKIRILVLTSKIYME